MGSSDRRALIAAHNNADLYAAMCDLHGVPYERDEVAFRTKAPPPPYFSWITTLKPDAIAAQQRLVAAQHTATGFGIKDSFDALDLSTFGLFTGFTAQWLWMDAPEAKPTVDWVRITTLDALTHWEAAWKSGGSPSNKRQFPDNILKRSDIAIWGRATDRGFDAGAIANISDDCVGLSNVFGRSAFASAPHLAASFAPGQPIVGYESGDDLDAALDVGFQATGQLRVWFS